MTEQITTRPEYDDEIDLIELCKNLWCEKITIVTCTAIVTLIGALYLLTTKPIYEATVQIQAPTAGELQTINNTRLISVEPGQALNELIYVVESNKFKYQLIDQIRQDLTELKGIPENKLDTLISNPTFYKINYPTVKNKYHTAPKFHALSITGLNGTLAAEIAGTIISTASKKLIEKWREEFTLLKESALEDKNAELAITTLNAKEQREDTIRRLREETQLNIKNLEDKINSRKNYILKNRENQVIELQQALEIAEKLNIQQPSTLNSMSNQAKASKQISVNTDIHNEEAPLYLRGTSLLKAELDSIRQLPKNLFLDSDLIKLETDLQAVRQNREIEILNARESDAAFVPRLQELKEDIRQLTDTQFPQVNIDFKASPAIAPQSPIKPRKVLILAVSIILGGMLGLFVAIGRITVRNAAKRASA